MSGGTYSDTYEGITNTAIINLDYLTLGGKLISELNNIPSGTNNYDYLYWNQSSQQWEVASTKVIIGKNAGINIADNTIILNASGTAINTTNISGFYVKPVRQATGDSFLIYKVSNGEFTYTNTVPNFSATDVNIDNLTIPTVTASKIVLSDVNKKLISSSYSESQLVLNNVNSTLSSIYTFSNTTPLRLTLVSSGLDSELFTTLDTNGYIKKSIYKATDFAIKNASNLFSGLNIFDTNDTRIEKLRLYGTLTINRMLYLDSNNYVKTTTFDPLEVPQLSANNTYGGNNTFSIGTTTIENLTLSNLIANRLIITNASKNAISSSYSENDLAIKALANTFTGINTFSATNNFTGNTNFTTGTTTIDNLTLNNLTATRLVLTNASKNAISSSYSENDLAIKGISNTFTATLNTFNNQLYGDTRLINNFDLLRNIIYKYKPDLTAVSSIIVADPQTLPNTTTNGLSLYDGSWASIMYLPVADGTIIPHGQPFYFLMNAFSASSVSTNRSNMTINLSLTGGYSNRLYVFIFNIATLLYEYQGYISNTTTPVNFNQFNSRANSFTLPLTRTTGVLLSNGSGSTSWSTDYATKNNPSFTGTLQTTGNISLLSSNTDSEIKILTTNNYTCKLSLKEFSDAYGIELIYNGTTNLGSIVTRNANTVTMMDFSVSTNAIRLHQETQFLNKIKNSGGSSALPSYTFSDATTTGLYYNTNIFGLSYAGNNAITISSTKITCSQTVQIPSLTASKLVLTNLDDDLISSSYGESDLAIKSLANTFSATQSFSAGCLTSNGSNTAPSYSFINSTNTGFYYSTVTSYLAMAVAGQTLMLYKPDAIIYYIRDTVPIMKYDNAGKVSIGESAGLNTAAATAGNIAIGYGVQSGTASSAYSVGIGYYAQQNSAGAYATSIGWGAGQQSCGAYSIAIGYGAGQSNIGANTIILNATSSVFNTTNTSRCYINPIRSSTTSFTVMHYDTTNKEVVAFTSSRRFKTNIQPRKINADDILKLQIVSFDEIETGLTNPCGLIAEDAYDCNPDFANLDGDGKPISINYFGLMMYSIEKNKQQEEEIKNLKQQVENLKIQIDENLILQRLKKMEDFLLYKFNYNTNI